MRRLTTLPLRSRGAPGCSIPNRDDRARPGRQVGDVSGPLEVTRSQPSTQSSGPPGHSSLGDLSPWEREIVGHRLRSLRQAADLTQRTLAKRLGVTQQAVAQAER